MQLSMTKKTLLGEGGIDGAINSAAGKRLLEKRMTFGGCETGQVRITIGYNLSANI